MIDLTERLSALRKVRGLSFTKASRLSGIARSNLYRYEQGRSRIPADAIPKLAKAYGVTVSDIFEHCEAAK